MDPCNTCKTISGVPDHCSREVLLYVQKDRHNTTNHKSTISTTSSIQSTGVYNARGSSINNILKIYLYDKNKML